MAQTGTRYLQGESDRFAEVRLSVLEARIEADLACGHHADVLGELAALCRAHPLREGLWAQWITALYRGGRQADALQAYQNLRSALGAELGIDPSPALRRLEAMVLAQDPRAAAARSCAPPTAGAISPQRWMSASKVALAGRDAELRALAAAWAAACAGRSATVLVSGDAGIGKSRLLREFARSVRQWRRSCCTGAATLNWRSPSNHSWSACRRPSRPVPTESWPTSAHRSSPNSPAWSPTCRAGDPICRRR